jgi:hypothetical protein
VPRPFGYPSRQAVLRPATTAVPKYLLYAYFDSSSGKCMGGQVSSSQSASAALECFKRSLTLHRKCGRSQTRRKSERVASAVRRKSAFLHRITGCGCSHSPRFTLDK